MQNWKKLSASDPAPCCEFDTEKTVVIPRKLLSQKLNQCRNAA
jgi:hypothetical protein